MYQIEFPRERRQLACKSAGGPPPRLPVKFLGDSEDSDDEEELPALQKIHKSEHHFIFLIEEFSQFANQRSYAKAESKYRCIQAMPWRIVVQKGWNGKDEPQYFDVTLECNPVQTKSDQWSCAASVTFKIRPAPQMDEKVEKKPRLGESSSPPLDAVRQLHHIFCNEDQSCSTRYTQLEELINPANGWYESTFDDIELEVVVKAELPCGVGLDLQNQFLTSIDRSYKFFESGDFSDCVVQYVDPKDSEQNKDFHVHKLMLASRSDVFAAMFSNKDTKESRESRVEIVDSTARAIQQMLYFMYAGKLPAEFKVEDATDLLELADKYQIKQLALVSEEHLVGSVTPETVCEHLVLADRHRAHSLWIACGQMLRDNLDKVKAQEKWAALEKSAPELVARVLEKLN